MGNRSRRLTLVGGGVFGFGFGAVVDVVVFHLVLQWHHLLSARYSPTTERGLRTNVFFDGVFSLAMLGVMVVGGALVWRAANRSTVTHSSTRLLGSVFVGVGLFNLIDGVVDHYLLGVHDVVHGTQALNPHWMGASLLVVGVGLLVLVGE